MWSVPVGRLMSQLIELMHFYICHICHNLELFIIINQLSPNHWNVVRKGNNFSFGFSPRFSPIHKFIIYFFHKTTYLRQPSPPPTALGIWNLKSFIFSIYSIHLSRNKIQKGLRIREFTHNTLNMFRHRTLSISHEC